MAEERKTEERDREYRGKRQRKKEKVQEKVGKKRKTMTKWERRKIETDKEWEGKNFNIANPLDTGRCQD